MCDGSAQRSVLHGPPVLRRPVGYDRVQRGALLADAAPRGDEVGVAPLVREGVGGAPRGHAPAEHVLPPLPLLFRFQPLAVLLDLRRGRERDNEMEGLWWRRRPGANPRGGVPTLGCLVSGGIAVLLQGRTGRGVTEHFQGLRPYRKRGAEIPTRLHYCSLPLRN